MMVKLTIRPQVKKKNRFSVFLEEEYLFSISQYTYHKLGSPTQVEVESVEAFRMECLFPEHYNDCLELLGRRMYSTAELRRKLSLRHCPAEISERILKKLLEEKYLSDEDYKESFIRSRQTYKKQGFEKIRRELLLRGISPDEEDYDREMELSNLRDLAKNLLLKHIEPKKIYSRLAAKGYRFSDIRDVMRELSSPEEEWEYEVTEDA